MMILKWIKENKYVVIMTSILFIGAIIWSQVNHGPSTNKEVYYVSGVLLIMLVYPTIRLLLHYRRKKNAR